MFNQYPYINLNDFNLDYILKAIKDMRYEVTNFVSINAIKYADPIQWNITRQYEKNTIVIDPVTGTAYISVAPVPAGVALTRPEYWTVVFDLQSFVTKANQNLANNYEEQTTTTATMNTTAGSWVIWGDVLYKALVNITAGDAYVVGSNIQRIVIEDVIKTIMQNIADEVQARQGADTALQDAIDDEVRARQGADTALQDAIDDEVQAINDKIGDLNDLTTTDKDSVVDAINEVVQMISDVPLYYTTPEHFGAVGDGVNDDTTALQAAFDSGLDVIFTSGKNYLTTATLTVPTNCKLYGNNAKITAGADMTSVIEAAFVSDLEVDGNLHNIQYGIYTSDTSLNARIYNCTVHGLRHSTLDVFGILNVDVVNKNTVYIVDSCTVYDLYSTDNGVVADPQGSATGIGSYSVTKCYIVNNTVYDIKSVDDGYGIYALAYQGWQNLTYIGNNMLHDIANTAIKIQVANAIIENNQITKNSTTITNDMVYCIRVYGSNVRICNNTFLNSGTNSLYILIDGAADAKIINNVFDIDNGTLAIRSTGVKTVISGCLFKTTGTSATYLISLENDTGMIEGNTIYCAYTNVISVVGRGHRIANNSILDGVGFSIEASYPSDLVIIDNEISGVIAFPQKCTNSLIRNNRALTISFVSGCDTSIINDNILTATGTALSLAGAKGCTLCNNITENATTAIAITYSSQCIVKNNIINAGAVIDSSNTTDSIIDDNITLAS